MYSFPEGTVCLLYSLCNPQETDVLQLCHVWSSSAIHSVHQHAWHVISSCIQIHLLTQVSLLYLNFTLQITFFLCQKKRKCIKNSKILRHGFQSLPDFQGVHGVRTSCFAYFVFSESLVKLHKWTYTSPYSERSYRVATTEHIFTTLFLFQNFTPFIPLYHQLHPKNPKPMF